MPSFHRRLPKIDRKSHSQILGKPSTSNFSRQIFLYKCERYEVTEQDYITAKVQVRSNCAERGLTRQRCQRHGGGSKGYASAAGP